MAREHMPTHAWRGYRKKFDAETPTPPPGLTKEEVFHYPTNSVGRLTAKDNEGRLMVEFDGKIPWTAIVPPEAIGKTYFIGTNPPRAEK